MIYRHYSIIILSAILACVCVFSSCSFAYTDAKGSAALTDSANDVTTEAPAETTEPEMTVAETTAPETNISAQPRATVKRLLTAALEPVGRCLYVWGGGWNEEDTGAGDEATTLGVPSRWLEFFRENGADYNHNETRYQIHDGLDCSGFVGYAVYQVFEDTYSDNGYVFSSGKMAAEYKKLFGGCVIDSSDVSDYLPGDIMCRNGHVYIVVGECSDGSILFMHASPPAVSLCGTPSTDGVSESDAVKLARKYMSEYRSECYEKFDTCTRGADFLKGYDQYRWDADTFADPDGYRGMAVEDIIADLFGE